MVQRHQVILFAFVICALQVSQSSGSLNFLFFGDWGLPGTNQSLIAQQMGIWAQEKNAAFVVTLVHHHPRPIPTKHLYYIIVYYL